MKVRPVAGIHTPLFEKLHFLIGLGGSRRIYGFIEVAKSAISTKSFSMFRIKEIFTGRRRNAQKKRVPVITGLGIVSPIGIGKVDFWRNLCAGRSGFDTIEQFDASSFPCKIAAEVKQFRAEDYLTKRQIKFLARGSQFACAAFKMAEADSGLTHFDPFRTDVIIGTATSGFAIIEEEIRRNTTQLRAYKPGEADPLGMVKSFIFAPAAAVALLAQARGYVSTVSSACASGLNAVGMAADRIRNGQTDVAIAGGVDTPINYIVLSAMCAAGMLNTSLESPKRAVRPFDVKRTKQALGEGSVVFILEEKQHAIERGATIYAEIGSFTHSTENVNELFLLQTSGERWAEVIREAVGDKGKSIGHINAHAPGDVHIDGAEAAAFRLVFGEKAASIPVASIKGAVGQGLSSAGLFQLAAAAMTIRTDTMPPNINCDSPDPALGLTVVTQPAARS